MLQAGPIALMEDTPYFRTCVSRYLVSQRLNVSSVCPGFLDPRWDHGHPALASNTMFYLTIKIMDLRKQISTGVPATTPGPWTPPLTYAPARKLVSIKDNLFLNVSNGSEWQGSLDPARTIDTLYITSALVSNKGTIFFPCLDDN